MQILTSNDSQRSIRSQGVENDEVLREYHQVLTIYNKVGSTMELFDEKNDMFEVFLLVDNRTITQL